MEKIKIDTMLKFKFPSTLKKNKTGNKIGFMMHQMNEENNEYDSDLWLLDTKTNTTRPYTTDGKTGNFYWEDNEHILFTSGRNKDEKKDIPFTTKVFRININGGEAKELFTLPVIMTDLQVIQPDELYVVKGIFRIGKELPLIVDEEATKKIKKDFEDEKDYEVLTEIPYWSNGSGYTDRKRSGLFLFNKKENTFKRLTHEHMSVMTLELSSSKDKILYTGNVFKNKRELTNHIYLYDLHNETSQQISPDTPMNYTDAIFLNDDQIITFATDMNRYGVNENRKFYILTIQSGEMKGITEDLDMSFWNSVGSDARFGSGSPHILEKKGDLVYFVSTNNDSSFLYQVTLDGQVTPVINIKGSLDHFCLLEDKIIEIALRGSLLPEIYSFENGQETLISDFNTSVLESLSYIKPEPLTLKRENEPDIHGWVIKPADFDPNKRYPAILDIHGGPKTVYGDVFFHEMQVWASAGYAVFFCNPRGSDGRGNAFADIRGKYGTIDYEDIMDFTDLVLEKHPYIDSKKIGVTGGSYGGYMTNWIIGHTNRFAAAASQRSISNWISKFCTTDIGYFFVYDQGGQATPWNGHEKLWENSPLKYADKVQTPTLFIHSEEDYRCWYPEGLQMFTALKYHGVESRLCMFRGENHELSRGGKPKHRMRRLQEIQEWFDKYLKD
ncbi:MAG TPA: S9 family peptidase [Thermotogota bacterium]|nr:S9 family peptidase [Thermotogota bacterium]HRW33961.1 S9 family peptidase [Thermotogota bacterium]